MAATEDEPPYDFAFSIGVFGDVGTGKSLLVACTQPASTPTMAPDADEHFGLSSTVHTYESRGATYRVQLWDVPGAPRYVASAERYASLTAGFALVFDLSRRPTFDRLGQWLVAMGEDGRSLPKVLIGNKADLPAGAGHVRSAEAHEFARRNGMAYFETSAIENQGVSEAFSALMASIIGRIPNPPEPSLLVDQRVQIGRKLAENKAFRAALFDVPAP